MCRVSRQRLDKGMNFWIKSYARKHHWRVPGHVSPEDLVQEGYLCYAKCLARYGTVPDQAHFMSLVKSTFANRVNDLSSQSSKNRSVRSTPFSDLALDDEEGAARIEEVVGSVDEEATFLTLLGQLPRELRELLDTLLSDARSPEFARGRRETVNEWLCRLAGLPSRRFDVEATLRRHLGLARSEAIPREEGSLFYVDGRLFTR